MRQKKYIALTIGPVIKTLQMAKHTREIWAASYLFSYIMKQILLETDELKKGQIILPATEGIKEKNKSGAGLYPDRLIYQLNDVNDSTTIKEFQKIIYRVTHELSSNILKLLEQRKKMLEMFLKNPKNFDHKNLDYAKKSLLRLEKISDINDVYDFLKHYLSLYFIEKTLPEETNPIIGLSPYLDVIELQSPFVPEEEINYIAELLYFTNGSFLIKDAFETVKKETFESILEISGKELFIDDELSDILIKHLNDGDNTLQEEILAYLKTKENYKTAHKYIAIIQADGDKIGETIKALYAAEKEEGLLKFSKKLLDFAKEAIALINTSGGQAVYAGGDDLLFFSPVVYNPVSDKRKEKLFTVFHLLNKLDKMFKNKFPKATLSYGLSISYYKFPMYEALSTAQELLFGFAKHFKLKNAVEKNAVAFKALKHSGQYFETTLNKDSNTYEKFIKLIEKNIDNESFLNSLPQKLLFYEKMLVKIGNDSQKVKHFIANNFNEPEHKKFETFLNDLGELIVSAFMEYKKDDAVKLIYSTLRMVKFLNRKDND